MPATNSTSPTGRISTGPLARYIERHSSKTVATMLWPVLRSASSSGSLRAVHRRAYRYDQTGPAEWIASSGGSYFAYTARISRVRDGHRLALTSAAKAFTRDIVTAIVSL